MFLLFSFLHVNSNPYPCPMPLLWASAHRAATDPVSGQRRLGDAMSHSATNLPASHLWQIAGNDEWGNPGQWTTDDKLQKMTAAGNDERRTAGNVQEWGTTNAGMTNVGTMNGGNERQGRWMQGRQTAGTVNGWDDTMTPPSLQMWDSGLFLLF
jgi:hypothetical protein